MNFVQIRSYDNYINANIQLSILQDEGINCYLKDEYMVTIEPFLSPGIGGMKLMVNTDQSKRALAIIDEADNQFTKTLHCPNCGQQNLESFIRIRKPSGFWQKISFRLLNGQEQEVKKQYHCRSCEGLFDEALITNKS